MPREVRFSRILPQTRGLTGRRISSPLARQYSERRFAPRSSAPSPALESAPTAAPMDIESGQEGEIREPQENTFLNTTGGRYAGRNMPISKIFAGPIMKSGRTLAGALAMGAPTQEAIFGSLAAATPLATFNVFNRGIPQSIAAKTAAQKIDQALSDVSPETEEGTAAAGYALSQDPDTELSRFLPEDSSAYQIADALNEQSSAPGTLPSLAFRKLADFIKSKGQNQAQPAPDVREDTGAGFSGAGTGQEGAGQEGAFDYGAGTGQSGAFDSDGNFGVTGQSGGTVTVDFGYDPNTDGPGIPAESIYGPAESLFDDEEGGQSASPGEGDGQADGGTVLCTVLYSIGIMPERIYQADVCYASTLNRNVVHGYRAWAQPLARGMERSGMLLAVMAPMVMLWANHMAYHGSGGAVGRKNVFGNICENVGMPICRFIGKFVR